MIKLVVRGPQMTRLNSLEAHEAFKQSANTAQKLLLTNRIFRTDRIEHFSSHYLGKLRKCTYFHQDRMK